MSSLYDNMEESLKPFIIEALKSYHSDLTYEDWLNLEEKSNKKFFFWREATLNQYAYDKRQKAQLKQKCKILSKRILSYVEKIDKAQKELYEISNNDKVFMFGEQIKIRENKTVRKALNIEIKKGNY